MWSLVNSCPAVFVSLSMIYLCSYSPVCSVLFRLVNSLLPGVSVHVSLALSCPDVYMKDYYFEFNPRLCVPRFSSCVHRDRKCLSCSFLLFCCLRLQQLKSTIQTDVRDSLEYEKQVFSVEVRTWTFFECGPSWFSSYIYSSSHFNLWLSRIETFLHLLQMSLMKKSMTSVQERFFTEIVRAQTELIFYTWYHTILQDWIQVFFVFVARGRVDECAKRTAILVLPWCIEVLTWEKKSTVWKLLYS